MDTFEKEIKNLVLLPASTSRGTLRQQVRIALKCFPIGRQRTEFRKFAAGLLSTKGRSPNIMAAPSIVKAAIQAYFGPTDAPIPYPCALSDRGFAVVLRHFEGTFKEGGDLLNLANRHVKGGRLTRTEAAVLLASHTLPESRRLLESLNGEGAEKKT